MLEIEQLKVFIDNLSKNKNLGAAEKQLVENLQCTIEHYEKHLK